jgi:hypothetical protein
LGIAASPGVDLIGDAANPIGTVAALMGIAAEELEESELMDHHPDYPVASCIIVTK